MYRPLLSACCQQGRFGPRAPARHNPDMTLALLALALLRSSALQESDGPSGVGDFYRPGAESVWVMEQAGKRLGYCASRYEGEVSLGNLRAYHFQEQVELELATPSGPLRQRFTLEHWSDAEGHPLRFDFRAQVADVKTGVVGVLANGKAELVVHQGPSEQKLTVDAPDGVYLLANNFVSELELLLALAPLPEESASYTLFSANNARAFPYRLNSSGTTPAGEIVLEDSLGERLILSPERQLLRVEVAAQGIVIRRAVAGTADARVEPFTIELATRPSAPDLASEEVTIADGDVSLAGTITRLKGAEGRLPAVFFLSGSGPEDRDGFAMGLDLGTHEILDRLTREGFCVLRVDDRGVGASTGPTQDLTFRDLVADGRRALRFLRARPDVDPTRVALIGHSEGGLSAPLLATEEPVAAVVLMAAPGRPLEALLTEQLRLGRELQGAQPAELDAIERELAAFLGHIAKDEPIPSEGLAPELAAFVPGRAWLKSHLGRDPLVPLVAVHCPILILQGARDVQVSAERDAPKIQAALDAAGHADHELRVFPELDHLFKHASQHPSELDYLKARPIDAEFLDVLVAWLKARLLK